MCIGVIDDYKICHIEKKTKPLCYVKDKLLVYKGGDFYLLDLNDFEKSYICSFCLVKKHKLLSKSRLLSRIFRLEFRAVVKIDQDKVLLSFKGEIYQLNIKEKNIEPVHKFRHGMNAPLSFAAIKNMRGFRDKYCYGEYFSNPLKKPVSIYKSDSNTTEWHEIYRFKKGEINHIHAIIPDYYRERVWIFTGDYGKAAAIWYTEDDFKTVVRHLSGNQQFRACVGFPTEEGLIYATDTPLEDNSIYLLYDNKDIRKLAEINGSSIYYTKYKDKLLLSTAVEGHADGSLGKSTLLSYKRGKGIKSWNCDLLIGNRHEGFKIIATYKKDCFPMGLMQFGTITFPSGRGETDKIVFYGNALKKIDGALLIIEKTTEIKGEGDSDEAYGNAIYK